MSFRYNPKGFSGKDIRSGYTRIDKVNSKGKIIDSFAVSGKAGTSTCLYKKDKDNKGKFYLKQVFIKSRSDFSELVSVYGNVPRPGNQFTMFG